MKATTIPTADFLKRASSVASFYGFSHYGTVAKKYAGVDSKRKLLPTAPQYKKLDPLSDETSEMVKTCVERKITSDETPTLLYDFKLPEARDSDGKEMIRFVLTVLGIKKSIAEALILKTTFAILDEIGISDTCVHINSMGDRDSVVKHGKELNSYLRKNINEMPATPRQALKKDIFQAYDMMAQKNHPMCENAPRSMQFLSDSSRKHLKEVLEFLETDQIPYEINSNLMGHRYCYTQTLFEIHERREIGSENENEALKSIAKGGRCDEIPRRMYRMVMPTVSIAIEYERNGGRKTMKAPVIKQRKPKIYFIQLGFNAKLRSLPIIETLRKAKIPLCQAIEHDSLGGQLEHARNLKTPYSIIMGQREVLDGTVIIRDMGTQAQNIIPISALTDHLKEMSL